MTYRYSKFSKELERLLNAHCMDQNTSTPDYILAEYLCDCLDAYVEARERILRHERGPELPEVPHVD